MKTSDFDYSLPSEFIAQTPVEPRDRSRLMVLNRGDGSIEHRRFSDITDYLRDGDVLVFNDSRVIPARLAGKKVGSGGRVEILLLRRRGTDVWETLVKPGKRVNVGARLAITDFNNGHESGVLAEVVESVGDGIKVISFSDETRLPELGEIPLPPYIHASLANPERYQTVYAHIDGSVAAPTAGLHFTPEILDKIKKKGVQCLFVTLHVGLDTFRPVREGNPLEHPVYKEYGVLGQEVAGQLSRAKSEERRIICAGTTTARIVEHAVLESSPRKIQPFEGWVNLFILPGFKFRMTDALVTNFHLPRTTLLMLVTAFAGGDFVKRAYEMAVADRYRFYSFGDAMMIV